MRPPVEEVLHVLTAAEGRDYIGEPVSQLDHSLQCAHFAREAEAPEAEILAALLHDVGHLCAPPDAPQMAGLGVVLHEEIGARYLLGLGFSAEVAELVRGHVQAKRYLTSRNPEYLANLSEASRGTLDFQGGPMTNPEREEFECDPYFKAKLRVRGWDERAKVAGLQVAGAETYRSMLERDLRD